jgi:toxin ParE1/3/4
VNVRFTPEAEEDLAEAQRWYRRRGTNVTRSFRQAVEAGLDLIERYPEGHPLVYRDVRRVLLRRFPYSLFFVVDGEIAVVIGCFHSARDPKTWQDRGDAALD